MDIAMIILCGYFFPSSRKSGRFDDTKVKLFLALLNAPSFYKGVFQFYMFDHFGILE